MDAKDQYLKNKQERKFSLVGPIDLADIKSPINDKKLVAPEIKAYRSLKNSRSREKDIERPDRRKNVV